MKHNFCTLFDHNYLYKGLALYKSLSRHCQEFSLWVLCMDDTTYRILDKLQLTSVQLIKASDFEDKELLEIKKSRTIAEYCWTCTPSLPLYVLKKNPKLEMISYLDSDLFFYGSPEPIFEEFGNRSIMIIEHRFPEQLKHLEVYGIYNVQMLIFRNNENGLACLQWWRERCLEWCYYKHEDGKMGDQKYLDDWTTRFSDVHVLQYKGAGVALWNVMKYKITRDQHQTFVDEVSLIFYHFHQFHLLKKGGYDFGDRGNYYLSAENTELIYQPYIHEIEKSIRQVKKVDHNFKSGYKDMHNFFLKSIFYKAISILKKFIYHFKKISVD